MPLDPRVQQFLNTLSLLDLKPVEQCTPEQARARTIAVIGSSPEVGRKQNWKLNTEWGSIPIRTYQPIEPFSSRVIFLHGGGWVFGTLEMYDQLCCWLTNSARAEVWSVDYRLAPEHPFPAGLQDSIAVIECALGQSDHQPVVLVGDSAGANLSTVAAMQLGHHSQLAGEVLIYPVTDCDLDRASYQEFAEGYFLTTAMMDWFWNHYIKLPNSRDSPDASPLRSGNHHLLPPTYLITAEYDILRDEGFAYAEALRLAGVDVSHHVAEGMIHSYIRHPGTFTQAAEDLTRIGAWIQTIAAQHATSRSS